MLYEQNVCIADRMAAAMERKLGITICELFDVIVSVFVLIPSARHLLLNLPLFATNIVHAACTAWIRIDDEVYSFHDSRVFCEFPLSPSFPPVTICICMRFFGSLEPFAYARDVNHLPASYPFWFLFRGLRHDANRRSLASTSDL